MVFPLFLLLTFSHLRYQLELLTYAVLRSSCTSTSKSPTSQPPLGTSKISKPFPISWSKEISDVLCLMNLIVQVRKLGDCSPFIPVCILPDFRISFKGLSEQWYNYPKWFLILPRKLRFSMWTETRISLVLYLEMSAM